MNDQGSCSGAAPGGTSHRGPRRNTTPGHSWSFIPQELREHTYEYTYIHTYIRTYVCMYVCTYVCMRACRPAALPRFRYTPGSEPTRAHPPRRRPRPGWCPRMYVCTCRHTYTGTTPHVPPRAAGQKWLQNSRWCHHLEFWSHFCPAARGGTCGVVPVYVCLHVQTYIHGHHPGRGRRRGGWARVGSDPGV